MAIQVQGRATSVQSEVRNGITYVPVVETIQELGGKAVWDNANKAASITIGQWTASVSMAAEEADVNGIHVNFNGPTYVEGDRLWAPVRFFEQAFGYKINVAGDTINIVNPNAG